MALINVIQSFVLTLEGNIQRGFQTGIQEVEDELLDHWWVKAHSQPVPQQHGTDANAAPAPVASDVDSDSDADSSAGGSDDDSKDANPEKSSKTKKK